MPFINSKINIKITQEQEEEIKSRLGKAIELIPGKSESWLMVGFEDDYHLYFKGENVQKIVFVEIKVFGNENKGAFEKMTEAVCDIYEDVLGINPANIYVKYETATNWGWNKRNF